MAENVIAPFPPCGRWQPYFVPQRVGETGYDMDYRYWIWLPEGLRELEMPLTTAEEEPDILSITRDVARAGCSAYHIGASCPAARNH
jgi:hypothetical protein